MVQVIKTTFQFKRGLAARWAELNPILSQGEPGFEYDTNKLKIGDGLTAWNNLPYQQQTNVVNAPTSLGFPATGEANVIYKAENEKQLYQWNSSLNAYEKIGADLDEVYQLISDLTSSVSDLEDAVDLLNADETQEGSVAYHIAQIVNGAPEEFNTLKKISDWIYDYSTPPIGNDTVAGLVKGSKDINKIQIGIDGTMEVNSLGLSKLIQEEDLTLVLDSGSSLE